MHCSLVDLIRRRGGVSFEDLVSLVPIESLNRIGERFGCGATVPEHGAGRLLLSVRSCQQRNPGLLAGFVDSRKRLWKEVSVQCGAESHSLGLGHRFLDLFRCHFPQGGEAICAGGSAELYAGLLCVSEGLRRQARGHRAAFPDCAGHQVPGERRCHQRTDRDRSGRFPRDRDAVGVAAEHGDILLYPPERGHLVEQPVVTGGVVRRLLGEFRMNEETENISPVIDRDGDNALARHIRAVITRLRPIAVLEASAENIDQDGEFLPIRLSGGPDVEVKAVFAHAVAAKPVVRARTCPLHAPGAELVGIADAAPGLQRLGLAPAKVSDRRLGERDSLEAAHAIFWCGSRFQDAVGHLDAIGSKRGLDRAGPKHHRGKDRHGSFHNVYFPICVKSNEPLSRMS